MPLWLRKMSGIHQLSTSALGNTHRPVLRVSSRGFAGCREACFIPPLSFEVISVRENLSVSLNVRCRCMRRGSCGGMCLRSCLGSPAAAGNVRVLELPVYFRVAEGSFGRGHNTGPLTCAFGSLVQRADFVGVLCRNSAVIARQSRLIRLLVQCVFFFFFPCFRTCPSAFLLVYVPRESCDHLAVTCTWRCLLAVGCTGAMVVSSRTTNVRRGKAKVGGWGEEEHHSVR